MLPEHIDQGKSGVRIRVYSCELRFCVDIHTQGSFGFADGLREL